MQKIYMGQKNSYNPRESNSSTPEGQHEKGTPPPQQQKWKQKTKRNTGP